MTREKYESLPLSTLKEVVSENECRRKRAGEAGPPGGAGMA